MKFAVVDIETSGFSGVANKITEIAIYVLEEGSVTERYSTLVNPDTFIPPHITQLTGITAAMVRDAPRFEDIADTVDQLTEDCIFVAHSVHFDYGIIQRAFQRMGRTFDRKKLCTVRYARAVFPGYKSYGLGNICRDRGISIQNRHRAEGDTQATVALLMQCLENDSDQKQLQQQLKGNSREATLPPNLPKKKVTQLPDSTGVYVFKDSYGKVIYVGKAKSIRKRVWSHFYSKTIKSRNMLLQIADIDYHKTGHEWVALLMEADLIRQHYPRFNSAQKKSDKLLQLTSYTNQRGIQQLAVCKMNAQLPAWYYFQNASEAHRFLWDLCEDFDLCPHYAGIQSEGEASTSVYCTRCEEGSCAASNTEAYNQNVADALASVRSEDETRYLTLDGRTPKEQAVVYYEKGLYRGFGFVPNDVPQTAWSKYLIPKKNNTITQALAQRFRVLYAGL